MFFLAPILPAVTAAVETALACEAAQMFVGGAAAAAMIIGRQGEEKKRRETFDADDEW
jgi:hypothetical protein